MQRAVRHGVGAVLALITLVAPAEGQLDTTRRTTAPRVTVPRDTVPRDSVRAQVIAPMQVTVTGRVQALPRVPWAVGTQELRDLRRGQATIGIDEALANIPGVVIANR
ncbi:MAG: hypothetical protein ACKORK_14175, partial [Gemmatimonadota bacterium]